MHLPFLVPIIISWSSLQILTPTILSLVSSFMAILPLALMFAKSSKLFFLTFPFAVTKTTNKFFQRLPSSGKGMIELIDWWLFKGNILNKDLPFELALPSGIFQALILKARPSDEKNITGVWVLAVKIWTTKSSSLVTMLLFPTPPLFCFFKLSKGLLFI